MKSTTLRKYLKPTMNLNKETQMINNEKPFIDESLQIGDIVNPDCFTLKGWVIKGFIADQNHEKAKMILEHPVTKDRTCLENRHYNINKEVF